MPLSETLPAAKCHCPPTRFCEVTARLRRETALFRKVTALFCEVTTLFRGGYCSCCSSSIISRAISMPSCWPDCIPSLVMAGVEAASLRPTGVS